MDAALEMISKVAQSTSIPLFMMSMMARVVRGSDESVTGGDSPLLTLISLDDAFEPDTAPIWDTQLPLLRTIQAAKFPGVPVRQLQPIFEGCRERFPEIFEGTTFSDWLSFCEDLDLILMYGGRVLLSTSGAQFMNKRVTDGRVRIC